MHLRAHQAGIQADQGNKRRRVCEPPGSSSRDASSQETSQQQNDRILAFPNKWEARAESRMAWRRPKRCCMTAIISGPKYGSIIPCREKKWFYRRNIFRIRLYFKKNRAERSGSTNGLISSQKGAITRVGNAREDLQNGKWPGERSTETLLYLDNSLVGRELEDFRSHLAACSICQRRLEKERTLSTMQH